MSQVVAKKFLYHVFFNSDRMSMLRFFLDSLYLYEDPEVGFSRQEMVRWCVREMHKNWCVHARAPSELLSRDRKKTLKSFYVITMSGETTGLKNSVIWFVSKCFYIFNIKKAFSMRSGRC